MSSSIEDFLTEAIIHSVTERSASISSEIYASLRKEGNPVDDIDLLIAGIAIEQDMTLITNNEKHFGRIPRLQLENWAKS